MSDGMICSMNSIEELTKNGNRLIKNCSQLRFLLL